MSVNLGNMSNIFFLVKKQNVRFRNDPCIYNWQNLCQRYLLYILIVGFYISKLGKPLHVTEIM